MRKDILHYGHSSGTVRGQRQEEAGRQGGSRLSHLSLSSSTSATSQHYQAPPFTCISQEDLCAYFYYIRMFGFCWALYYSVFPLFAERLSVHARPELWIPLSGRQTATGAAGGGRCCGNSARLLATYLQQIWFVAVVLLRTRAPHRAADHYEVRRRAPEPHAHRLFIAMLRTRGQPPPWYAHDGRRAFAVYTYH